MVTLFKSNMHTCIYWLIENFLCSFLNYPLIAFLQSNMIQFVACTLQYRMIMYSTDILRKLQCIYNAYRNYCTWKYCNFFVFIRIIKIIHVGLGCHLGFNFVHQFSKKVKKKIGLYNRSKSQKSTRTKRVSSSFDRSQWKAKRTTGVCVYITIKTPQGDRCTISCQGASGHS